MNIQVQHKDASGHESSKCYSLTKPAFLKHFIMAGHKEQLSEETIQQKMNGALSYYRDYLQPEAFNADHFSLPPIEYADPTERSHFSNRAGLAIADFLAKRIDNAIYTGTYEAALGEKKMKIEGMRPDLLAFRKDKQVFAIEAKGRSKGCGGMKKRKKQAESGEIPVNFSVACVSYNIYKKIKCKYYDPVDKNASFDEELFKALTKEYYKGFMGFLNLPHSEFKHKEESFYTIKISDIIMHFFGKDAVKLNNNEMSLQLLIPENIKEYAKNGMPFWKPIEDNNDEKLYIDNDRIGIRLMGNQ